MLTATPDSLGVVQPTTVGMYYGLVCRSVRIRATYGDGTVRDVTDSSLAVWLSADPSTEIYRANGADHAPIDNSSGDPCFTAQVVPPTLQRFSVNARAQYGGMEARFMFDVQP
jgi:hypothetical protein